MEYSVVIPVYNSQGSLQELYERICITMQSLTNDFEVIFVDDFSKDNSWEKLLKIKAENQQKVKLIKLAKNYGQHNATFCGFKYASGNRIITIDDDLQYSPGDILLLIKKMDETDADLVYGVGNLQHTPIRNASSAIYKQSAKFFEGKKIQGSSFRLICKTLVDKIINHEYQFIYIDEIIPWYTNYIEMIKVQRIVRPYGESGYSVNKAYKLAVKNTLNYSDLPLRIMINGGALLSLFFFLVGIYFIIKKLYFNVNVPGFTGLIVAISFSTSLILMCFGIIGRYMNNILSRLNEKPTFSIKSVQL